MKLHELKIEKKYVSDILLGLKKFEVRKDDRGQQMIDTIIKCDKCPTVGESITEEHNFQAPMTAKRLLMGQGWAFREHEHLCDACVRAERSAELENAVGEFNWLNKVSAGH
jgi:hypothetical protein